jgi:putative spermidine/putrescine transport system ATP-binding protein
MDSSTPFAKIREVSQGGVDDIVSLRNLSMSYGRMQTVLHDLSLDVRRGEFLTLLGPSGSGKTTTLMLIAGFQYPSDGQILIDGKDVTALAPHRRQLGVVFQSYALFPQMTVHQNIAFPLKLRKLPRQEIDDRVRQALDLVHLSGLGERRTTQLSGGQQQRVALARALVYRPKIVLMDEPLGALDRGLRDSMQREFREIHRTLGMTFVYVTHDQHEALTMSDRIAVLKDGRLVQIGPPEEVYRRPANTFVASFLGDANLLEGKIAGLSDNQATVRLLGGQMVQAPKPYDASVGSAVSVLVRPDAVRLGDGSPNALRGTLQDAAFHGDHFRLQVAVEGGITISAKIASHGVLTPSIGEAIAVGFSNVDPTIVLTRT